MAAQSIALILGVGPRVGTSIAEKFASNGYKVAIASRSGTGTQNEQGYLSLKADFTVPDSIPALFEAVKSEFKAPPNVVIYNAAATTNPPDQNSIFSLSAETVTLDTNVNTISPYVAAQQAVIGWAALPNDAKKTFIYTGNVLNTLILPVPMLLNLGIGKAASAYWIGVADTIYSGKGPRFFYADQRTEDGKNVGNALDGPAHAAFYTQLAEHEGNVPWHATFVKNKGYVQFK